MIAPGGRVNLEHGGGGMQAGELVKEVFIRRFSNSIINRLEDSAVIDLKDDTRRIAFTTDSFVVNPPFFKGGDIGKLSVCGTVNDLAAIGAQPRCLTFAAIIEEGYPIDDLEKIVQSAADTASLCGVEIVAGDTKVVQKGAADKIFINTSGIGIVPDGISISCSGAVPGDKVIVSGPVGDHGCAVMLSRQDFGLKAEINSDCAPLNAMVSTLLKVCGHDIHAMRDPTRGGLAAVLNEMVQQSRTGILVHEDLIPVRKEVKAVCDILGLEPLYMACEGRMVIVASSQASQLVLDTLKKSEYGADAAIIGEITQKPQARVLLKTLVGGVRILDMPSAGLLPRIC